MNPNENTNQTAPTFSLLPKTLGIALAIMLAITLTDIHASDLYDYGDPSPEEQYALELINRARMNPLEEAARYGIDLQEGVDAGEISGDQVQPLTMNSALSEAARGHSEEMMENNYFAHESLDGSSPFDRMIAAGYYYLGAGENLALRAYSYYTSASDATLAMHGDLFVDESYPGRGHRVNMLRDTFREAGISIVEGPYTMEGYTYQYSFIETCDFGLSSSDESGPFILGTVYNDLDNDNEYDTGEGAGGFTVTAGGTLQTITASAGGYAIPVQSNGTYDIVLSDSGNILDSKTVTISGLNVKVDFIIDGTGAGDDTGNDNDAVSPPAAQVVGFWDKPATAPIIFHDNMVDIYFNYSSQVAMLAGVMDNDFNTTWLNEQCAADENIDIIKDTQWSCNNVPVPADTAYIFWLVSPVPLDELDWSNGIYELYFYMTTN